MEVEAKLNVSGQGTTELLLMLAVVVLMVLVGTRLVRNALYPPLESVKEYVEHNTECGQSKCNGNNSFNIKRVNE